jgi:hypothetical protein
MGEDVSKAPVVRDLDLSESPERKMDASPEVLLKFKADQERRAQEKAAKGNQGGGFGDFGGGSRKAEAVETQAYDGLYVACLSVLIFGQRGG